MSTRLQIVVDEAELARFRAAADRISTTLADWARRALREAERSTASGDLGRKLEVIHTVSACDFPAPSRRRDARGDRPWRVDVNFVDSNIPMDLVGGKRPHQADARRALERAVTAGDRLMTDAEVYTWP